MTERAPTAVLISGRGSNMEALIQAARVPAYPAKICIVISNRPDAPGLKLAEDAGIPAKVISHHEYPDRRTHEDKISEALIAAGIECVCLAGYMRILSAQFVARWRDRLINIHPSLLPAFKGLDTHTRALAAGCRLHGATVHFVRAEMDDGPIIIQGAVPVLDGDDANSLAERVLKIEHVIYPKALGWLAAGRLQIRESRVSLELAAEEPGNPLIWPVEPLASAAGLE